MLSFGGHTRDAANKNNGNTNMNEAPTNNNKPDLQSEAITIFIRIALLIAIVSLCLQIVSPFIGIVLWAIILAVALYPAHRALTARLKGREGRSATLIVLIGLAIVILPVWFAAESTVVSTKALAADLQDGNVTIPPPGDQVRDWPVIGERVHATWSGAATDLEAMLDGFRPQLEAASQQVVRMLGGLALGVLQFAISLIVAGALLVRAEGGYRFSCGVASRIVGERGPYMTDLSVATVRSVTKGVLGVAFIQAVLSTIGLVVMDVPAAGIFGAIVLVTAIVQIPTILIMGPIAFWVFSVAEPVPATLFAVYAVLVSLSDNVLKPMLLGRGVDLPMLVILLGAIGGAIAGGVIGLFVGAVVLALSYVIFTDWAGHEHLIESDEDVAESG